MDVITAIKKRKSIRKYKPNKISKKIINQLIESARLAPSSRNSQPWKFKIITERKIINQLYKNKIFKHDFVYNAPLIIVCCGDIKNYPNKIYSEYSNIIIRERVITDLAIASQNIILRATELNLGTCYIGIFNEKKLKKILKIPQDYILHYVITVGYPAEKGIKNSRKNISEIVF